MMCSDAGYSRGTYTGSERTAWYNTAAAHNTLTIDGHPADQKPSNTTPASHYRIEQAGLVGEEKQTSFPKNVHWARALFWIGGDYYVVIDRVTGAAESIGEVKSYLHGGRGTLVTAGAERTWTYGADRYGPAARLRSWIAAPGAVTEVKQGELTYIKGDYATFPYLETTSRNFSAPWITLLKPAGGNATSFSVEDRSTGAFSALVISAADHRTVIAARAQTAPIIAFGDIETDATLVIVRRDAAGKILNHFVENASYLRVAGHALTLP